MDEGQGMNSRENSEIEVRFAGLSQRVTGMETAIKQISSQISGLANSFNERSRTPWGVLFAGVGVLVTVMLAVGGLAYSPILNGLTRADADIQGLRANGLSVAAFEQFKSTYENNRIANRTDTDAKFGILRDEIAGDVARIDKMLDQQVPRAEHERVWDNYSQQDVAIRDQLTTAVAGLQRQIDELNRANSSVYGTRDIIRDLQAEIGSLRDRIQTIPAPTS